MFCIVVSFLSKAAGNEEIARRDDFADVFEKLSKYSVRIRVVKRLE